MRYWSIVWNLVILLAFCAGWLPTFNADKTALKKADAAFAAQQYALAATLYTQVVQDKPAHKQANYRLGLCYLELHEPAKARIYLRQAHALDARVAEDILFVLGEAHQLDYDFEQGLNFFKQELQRSDRRDRENLDLLQKRIGECEAGTVLATRAPVAAVVNVGAGINSMYSDYVPVVLEGDSLMLYTTRRPAATKGSPGAGTEQIRVSSYKKGVWQPSVPFLQPGDALPAHAVVSVAPHGRELYTYAAGQGLFVSEKQGSGWSAPAKLGKPFNRGTAELSIHVTDDGRFAFFSSNREGGYGGLDLYMCYRKPDHTWSDALNLGPNINTEHDEDAPFVDVATNTLYFSSRGHNTIGGFDIFKSGIKNSAWSKAANLGMPVNSPFDDIYFSFDNKQGKAYFSSDRAGGYGAKDIYSAEFLK